MSENRKAHVNWHTTQVRGGQGSTYGFTVMANLWDVPSDWLELRLAADLHVMPNLVRVESGYQDDRGTSSGSIAVAGITNETNPGAIKVVVENAVEAVVAEVQEAQRVAEQYEPLFRGES